MFGFNYFLDIYTYIYIIQIAPYNFYVNKTTVTTDIYIYIDSLIGYSLLQPLPTPSKSLALTHLDALLRPVIMEGSKQSGQRMAYLEGPNDVVPNGRGSVPPGTHPNGLPPNPPKREVKPPKPKGFKVQANTKIKLCAAKLMDVKYWLNKVNESSLYHGSMIAIIDI